MTKPQKFKFEFSPLSPVFIFHEWQIHEIFGEYSKYDFPKLCKEQKARCFYKPETRIYVVIPEDLREL